MNTLRTLASAVLFLYSVAGLAAAELGFERTTISVVAGEELVQDLSDLTGLQGKYGMVAGPEWLTLTERGIVYGTPELEHVGINKLYGAVENGSKTDLFLIEFDVQDPSMLPTVQLTAKVGEVFLARLGELVGQSGTFSYENLPTWLEGTERGVLVGKPAQGDVGRHEFAVTIEGPRETRTFLAEIQVQNPGQAYTPVAIRVGQFFSVDVVKTIGLSGRYTVQAPRFLTLTKDGILSGTPTREDVGFHRVWIEVRQGVLNVHNFYFDLVVEN